MESDSSDSDEPLDFSLLIQMLETCLSELEELQTELETQSELPSFTPLLESLTSLSLTGDKVTQTCIYDCLIEWCSAPIMLKNCV